MFGPLADHSSCSGIREQLQAAMFIGMVDASHMLAQRQTELLLINLANLARDLFYQQVCASSMPDAISSPTLGNLQHAVSCADSCDAVLQVLRRWGACHSIKLQKRVQLDDMIRLALESLQHGANEVELILPFLAVLCELVIRTGIAPVFVSCVHGWYILTAWTACMMYAWNWLMGMYLCDAGEYCQGQPACPGYDCQASRFLPFSCWHWN